MLLEFTDRGLYCPQADVYIDPWRPVPRALITHGHSDHSRWGHQHYLCTTTAAPVIRYRLGDINLSTIDYGETIMHNGVQFSFHPAGHILGSAQIRLEYKGEVWVVSGDYKLQNDGLAEAFEPIRCHTFITESTFGLPIYQWEPQEQVHQSMNDWWRANQAAGKTSVLYGYALGKAQRILNGLDPSIGPIFTHAAVENTNEIMRHQGVKLPETIRVTKDTDRQQYPGAMVVAVPGALGSAWLKQFKSPAQGYVSGWMRLRGARRRRAVDRGFILSDHADWPGLNTAIKATGAERIFVTHGYTDIFSKWLREQGYDAQIVKTEFGEEEAVEQES
ncbi:MAG: ligase-associated DNA damage response exonuclease [Bacteroidota bacterium]